MGIMVSCACTKGALILASASGLETHRARGPGPSEGPEPSSSGAPTLQENRWHEAREINQCFPVVVPAHRGRSWSHRPRAGARPIGRAVGRMGRTTRPKYLHYKGRHQKVPARKRRAMGRIEHTLLVEGRTSSPTDLRPSPATPPYHTK